MITVVSMVSGRSAGFWGSHHRRFLPSKPWSAIPTWHRTGPGQARQDGLDMAAIKQVFDGSRGDMGLARFGTSYAAKGAPLPAARWRG